MKEDRIYTYTVILRMLVTKMPHTSLTKVPPVDLNDNDYLALQDWCANYAEDDIFTGNGIIQTAWNGSEVMCL